jgi:hypothetical protein
MTISCFFQLFDNMLKLSEEKWFFWGFLEYSVYNNRMATRRFLSEPLDWAQNKLLEAFSAL